MTHHILSPIKQTNKQTKKHYLQTNNKFPEDRETERPLILWFGEPKWHPWRHTHISFTIGTWEVLVGSVTLGVAVEAANTVGPSCEEKFPDDYGAIFVDVVVYIFCSMSCKLIDRRVISFAAVFRDVTQRPSFRGSVAWHSERRLPRRLSEGQWKRKTNVKRSEVLVNLKKPVQFSVPCHIEGHINNKKLQNRIFFVKVRVFKLEFFRNCCARLAQIFWDH